jgi:hypothetical protein
LLAWIGVAPFRVEVRDIGVIEGVEGDPNRIFTQQFATCVSDRESSFQAALFAVKGTLLAFGTLLAVKVRNVEITGLNDSKQIGMTVYASALVLGVVVPVSFVSSSNEATFAFASIGVLLVSSAAMAFLFIPKIVQVYAGVASEHTGESACSTQVTSVGTKSNTLVSTTYPQSPTATRTQSITPAPRPIIMTGSSVRAGDDKKNRALTSKLGGATSSDAPDALPSLAVADDSESSPSSDKRVSGTELMPLRKLTPLPQLGSAPTPAVAEEGVPKLTLPKLNTLPVASLPQLNTLPVLSPLSMVPSMIEEREEESGDTAADASAATAAEPQHPASPSVLVDIE